MAFGMIIMFNYKCSFFFFFFSYLNLPQNFQGAVRLPEK